jgi:DNA invertase Pin-like site-specific DNA recombinase
MKQQGLRVIVAQLGEDADLFTIHIYAALAEKEKLNIGQRTSSALQAVKAKGTVLGNKVNLPQAAAKGRNTQVAYANKFASQIESVLSSFLSVGKSFNSIAQEFNKLGIETARGGKWTARSVINCYNRLPS